ncbi:MAG: hypothetical protein LBG27_01540 [Spirochaetaceae bacterium]|nr:hypothetical protein [Spirochaetaceae bacterium]
MTKVMRYARFAFLRFASSVTFSSTVFLFSGTPIDNISDAPASVALVNGRDVR